MRKILRIVALVAGLTLFAAVAACSPAENEGAASAVYYTVTFDAQGGSEVESRSVLAGNPVRRPANPVRAEYSFVGWFDEAEGGERWDFDTDRVTEDLTLYAHWNALPAEGEGFVRSGKSRDGIAIDARRPRKRIVKNGNWYLFTN